MTTIEKLLDAAEAVLDSSAGVMSMSELAAALYEADPSRDYRKEYEINATPKTYRSPAPVVRTQGDSFSRMPRPVPKPSSTKKPRGRPKGDM